jgi:hypothetical protein
MFCRFWCYKFSFCPVWIFKIKSMLSKVLFLSDRLSSILCAKSKFISPIILKLERNKFLIRYFCHEVYFNFCNKYILPFVFVKIGKYTMLKKYLSRYILILFTCPSCGVWGTQKLDDDATLRLTEQRKTNLVVRAWASRPHN